MITAATQPDSNQATLSMSAPQYVRGNSYGTITITYANNLDHEIAAPLLNVTATNALLRLPDETSFSSDKAEFLGISTSGPAGVLEPGFRGQITLFFQVNITDLTSNVSFNLYPSLDYYNIGDVGTTQEPIDWASVEASFRPSSISVDAWPAVWSNFLASVGSNVAQFHTRLDIDANYLSQLGEYEYDIANLLSFELGRANDYLPVQTLTSAVDVSLPVPGTALDFGREFMQPISGRYQLGPLGRGWIDNWDMSLTVDSSGNVTIDQSGQDQTWLLNPDGSYRGGSGTDDDAQLTLTAGVYMLRDPDAGVTLAFGSQGTFSFIKDDNGNRITAGYTDGQLTSLTDSNGEALTISYNAAGCISQITDSAGQVTSYTYDASGQYLLSVSGPQGTTSYTYITGQSITQDNASSMTFTDGTHEYFAYDSQGQLVEESRDGNAEAVYFSYPSPGAVATTDVSGATTTTLYNEYAEPCLVTDPLGQTTQYAYGLGLAIQSSPIGTDYYQFDAIGSTVGVTNSGGASSTPIVMIRSEMRFKVRKPLPTRSSSWECSG